MVISYFNLSNCEISQVFYIFRRILTKPNEAYFGGKSIIPCSRNGRLFCLHSKSKHCEICIPIIFVRKNRHYPSPRELPLPNPCIFWLDVSCTYMSTGVLICYVMQKILSPIVWRGGSLDPSPPKKACSSLLPTCAFPFPSDLSSPSGAPPLSASTFSPPFQSLFFYAAKVSPAGKREREREGKRRKGHEHALSAASVARSEPWVCVSGRSVDRERRSAAVKSNFFLLSSLVIWRTDLSLYYYTYKGTVRVCVF